MKKVARLRLAAEDSSNAAGCEQVGVRTTGRIKKPKAVFDPSDNYLPRAQRAANATVHPLASSVTAAVTTAPLERKRDSDGMHIKRLSQSSGHSICTTASLTSPALPADVCYVCNKRESKRGIGAKNKLVACVECEIKVHKMCLKLDFEDYDILRANFKCDNCRSCTLCSAFAEMEARSDGEFVTCAKCVKSYHLTCHIPNVHKYQQHTNNWKCNKCSPLPTIGNGSMLAAEAIREIIGDDSGINIATSRSADKQQNVNIAAAAEEAKNSAVKRNLQDSKNIVANDTTNSTEANEKPENKKQKIEESSSPKSVVRYSPNEPLELPDVKYWSVDQVTEFFAKYFPNEAYVFKEHEIDGMSLLLLKRSDVIKKLPIKLGPSLRIYSLILKIQTQLNDPTLGWNCM